MFDFSAVDPRLLFPSVTESWAMAFDSAINILSIISFVFVIVAEWKLFKKFGEKSWKSLVPYYNSYIIYKHVWSKKVFWLYIASSTMFDITQFAAREWARNDPANMLKTLFIFIGVPFGIIAAVCSILYAFRLAEAFGKGKLFSVGLLLLYPIFISILGLGKAQYVGNSEEGQMTTEAKLAIEGEVV